MIVKGLRVLAESGEYLVARRTLALEKRQAWTKARLEVLEAKATQLRAVLDSLRKAGSTVPTADVSRIPNEVRRYE